MFSVKVLRRLKVHFCSTIQFQPVVAQLSDSQSSLAILDKHRAFAEHAGMASGTGVTVSIVEDHAKTRANLVKLFTDAAGFRCVSAHATIDEALAEIPKLRPQVALVDLVFSDGSGIDCTRQLKEKSAGTRVLVLTAFDDADKLFGSLKAGADGYLLKSKRTSEILEAIHEVMDGGAPMSRTIARKVLRHFHVALGQAPAASPPLSHREQEILEHVATGLANKEIADLLGISYDTVRTHLRRVYDKLHVSNRTEAAAKFVRRDRHD